MTTFKFEEISIRIAGGFVGNFWGEFDVDAEGVVDDIRLVREDTDGIILLREDSAALTEIVLYALLRQSLAARFKYQIEEALIAAHNSRFDTAADHRIDAWKHEAAE